MRLSIFTKLFLIYIFFTVIPIIITSILVIFNYQKIIESFFAGIRQEISTVTGQELFSVLSGFEIQIIFALIIIIFLSLCISFLLERRLTSSFQKIVKGIKEAEGGNLDFIIDVKSKDELGDLASHFNEMARQLKKARLSLEEIEDTIKAKVAANTRELEKMAETREKTIKQRTKELQDRIDELEIIHRLSVGRELKMIELKNEVEKLKAGTPPQRGEARSMKLNGKAKKS